MAELTTLNSNKIGFKRIYRFELYVGSSLEHTFNFIVSPQTYSINEKNRYAITKTLQGTHVDLFGEDNKTINLSGNFGLNEKSSGWDDKIVNSKAVGAFGALRYFRDKFVRFTEWAGDESNNIYIKFYDFSKEIETNQDGWYVILEDFTVSRDTSNILGYKWAMKVTSVGRSVITLKLANTSEGGGIGSSATESEGWAKLEEKKKVAETSTSDPATTATFGGSENGVDKELVAETKSHLSRLIKRIGEASKKVEGFNQRVGGLTQTMYSFRTAKRKKLFALIREMTKFVKNLRASISAMQKFAEEAINFGINVPLDFLKEVNVLVDETLNLTYDLLTAPTSILDNIAQKGAEINGYLADTQKLVIKGADIFGIPEGFKEGSIVAVKWQQSIENVEITFQIMGKLATSSFNGARPFRDIAKAEADRLRSEGLSEEEIQEQVAVITDKTMAIFSLQSYDTSLSISQIADQAYGDANLTYLISEANPGIAFDNRSTEEVYIPLLFTRAEIDANEFDLLFDDNLNGQDILVDKTKTIAIGSTGDIAIVSDTVNTVAKFSRQLEIGLGDLGSDNNYGLDPSIGEADVEAISTSISARVAVIINETPQILGSSSVLGVRIDETGVYVETKLDLTSGVSITSTTKI